MPRQAQIPLTQPRDAPSPAAPRHDRGAPRAAPPYAGGQPARRTQPRYSSANQLMHWATALCMFAILPLAWVMTHAKPGLPATSAFFNWHKTLGLAVLLITLFRLGWRLVDGPPDYPAQVARWERRLAHAAYWLFFLVLVWMPVTGYITSIYSGHPPKLFNAIPTPQLAPRDKALGDLFANLHSWGQWVVYALIALHLSAVAFHLVFRKSGVLGRMLPANATEPAE